MTFRNLCPVLSANRYRIWMMAVNKNTSDLWVVLGLFLIASNVASCDTWNTDPNYVSCSEIPPCQYRSILDVDYKDTIQYNIMKLGQVYSPDKIPQDYYNTSRYYNDPHECYPEEVSLNIQNDYLGLVKLLDNFIPSWKYIGNQFDCSEMSAYTEHKLKLYGFDAKICTSHNFRGEGLAHAWVAVDLPVTKDWFGHPGGRYYIEATKLDSGSGGLVYPAFPKYGMDGSADYAYYSDYQNIYDDIYDACQRVSIDEFNWWVTLKSMKESYNSSLYIEALGCYDSAIDRNPMNGIAWDNKALILYYLGQYEDAINCSNKAIAYCSNVTEPGDISDAWINKGNALYALGKYNESIECYDESLKIFSDIANDQALYNKALALRALNRLSESESILDTVRKHYPQSYTVRKIDVPLTICDAWHECPTYSLSSGGQLNRSIAKAKYGDIMANSSFSEDLGRFENTSNFQAMPAR